jgi:hypothetical protein
MNKEIVVKLITENHHYDSVLRQLPAEGYKGYKFFSGDDIECDAAIVFDYAKNDIPLKCDPKNVWLWNMEPPDEEWEWLRKGYKYYEKVITVDHQINHPKLIKNQLAIPWQINKTYDELSTNDFFDKKTKDLSFITSNYAARKGHKKRLKFLSQIDGKLKFDLWGRGFRTMDDKFDALQAYKYSIVIENSQHKDYWSEKIADAFLSGTLPFYFGCPNISDYYDKGSFIPINIENPKKAIEIIINAIENKEWEKRQHLIMKAKDKVLNEYQFFPLFIKLFNQYGNKGGIKKDITIPMLSHHVSEIKPFTLKRNLYLVKRTLFKKRYLDLESPSFGFTTYK